MKKWFTLLCAGVLFSFAAQAQYFEIGIGAGTSNFLGDLGKKEAKGKFYFGDLEASLFKPAASFFVRNSFSKRFSVRLGLTYGMLEGDDRLSKFEEVGDNAWYRYHRNLHFKSHIIEGALTAEFNILKYVPGSLQHRITPYIFGGVAIFAFDPKAQYNGEWVRLQPIGTEGQGLPQYPDKKKYSLIQPAIPLGIGVKFNATKFLSLGLEFGHRVTFTDYIDDVSTTYADPRDINYYYGEERAQMVNALANRSTELDPEGQYDRITAPGEYRGNPEQKDAYLFSQFTVSYIISKHKKGGFDFVKSPFKNKGKNLQRYRAAF